MNHIKILTWYNPQVDYANTHLRLPNLELINVTVKELHSYIFITLQKVAEFHLKIAIIFIRNLDILAVNTVPDDY